LRAGGTEKGEQGPSKDPLACVEIPVREKGGWYLRKAKKKRKGDRASGLEEGAGAKQREVEHRKGKRKRRVAGSLIQGEEEKKIGELRRDRGGVPRLEDRRPIKKKGGGVWWLRTRGEYAGKKKIARGSRDLNGLSLEKGSFGNAMGLGKIRRVKKLKGKGRQEQVDRSG